MGGSRPSHTRAASSTSTSAQIWSSPGFARQLTSRDPDRRHRRLRPTNSPASLLAPPTTSARSKIIATLAGCERRITSHRLPSTIDPGPLFVCPVAPLKASGGWAAVVDLDGREVIPTQALQAARTAIDGVQLPNLLRALNLPSTPLPAQPSAPPLAAARAARHHRARASAPASSRPLPCLSPASNGPPLR